MGIYTLTNLFFLGLYFTQESASKGLREYFFGVSLIVLVSLLIISNYYISMKVTIKSIKEKCSKKDKNSQEDVSKIDKIGQDSTLGNSTVKLAKDPTNALEKTGKAAKAVGVAGLSGVRLQKDLGDKQSRVRALTDKNKLSNPGGSKVKAGNKVRQPNSSNTKNSNATNQISGQQHSDPMDPSNDSVVQDLQSQDNQDLQSQHNRSVSTTKRNKQLKTVGP